MTSPAPCGDDDALPVSSPAPGGAGAAVDDDRDDRERDRVTVGVECDEVASLMGELKVLVREAAVLPEGELMVTRLRAATYRLRAARDASARDDAATATDRLTAANMRMQTESKSRTNANATKGDVNPADDAEVDGDDESELMRETARSRALARSSREILAFWTGLATDPSGATRLLHRVLCVALRGHPGLLDSARDLAKRHASSAMASSSSASAAVGGDGARPRALTHEEMHAASDNMMAWQSAANFGTGFTAGLGEASLEPAESDVFHAYFILFTIYLRKVLLVVVILVTFLYREGHPLELGSMGHTFFLTGKLLD